MSYIRKQFKRFVYFLPRILLVSVFFLYVVFALLSYFDYFEQYIYPLTFIRGKAAPLSENIIMGPYPHYAELKLLKEKYGVTGVVSLLNLKLPQEKALYEREEREAAKLNLKVFSFPLEYLPLRSQSNRDRLTQIIAFAEKNRKSKIYIHCYLGKHRVGFVREGLTEAGLVRPDKSGGEGGNLFH